MRVSNLWCLPLEVQMIGNFLANGSRRKKLPRAFLPTRRGFDKGLWRTRNVIELPGELCWCCVINQDRV